jgi:chromosome segregation ATPase
MEEQGQVFVERSERTEKSLGSRLLGFLLRLFFVILIGVGIGVAAYYGVPAFYRDFIQPIQTNTQRISALEGNLASVQADIREKQSSLSNDIAGVEGEVASHREELAVLNAQGEGLKTSVDEIQSELEGIPSLSDRIQAVEGDLESLGERLNTLELAVEEENPPIEEIQIKIQFLRVMELVTRARMWLIQDNLGEAKDELAIAKEILENLEAARDDESLVAMIERLDQILFEIPLSPVIAADDLEIVWQLLILATAP